MTGERDVARAEDVLYCLEVHRAAACDPPIKVSFAALSEFHVICTFSLPQRVKLVIIKLLPDAFDAAESIFVTIERRSPSIYAPAAFRIGLAAAPSPPFLAVRRADNGGARRGCDISGVRLRKMWMAYPEI